MKKTFVFIIILLFCIVAYLNAFSEEDIVVPPRENLVVDTDEMPIPEEQIPEEVVEEVEDAQEVQEKTLPKEASVEAKHSSEEDTALLELETLELKDMDILDVLKLISKKSGLNIAAGKNVKGKVTIFLKNVGVWDALRIILEANDLAFIEEEGIVKVMTDKEYESIYGKKFADKTTVKIVPLKYAVAADVVPLVTQIKSVVGKVIADEKSNTIVLIDTPVNIEDMKKLIEHLDISTITEVFSLKYAKAEDIVKSVSGILTAKVGRIDVDARTNKVVVTDTAVKMQQIAKMIAAFDEKTPQVNIEAKIIQIELSDQFQMGIDWDKVFSSSDENLKLAGNFNPSLNAATTGTGGAITVGGLSNYSYYALIEALQTVGKTNTLSTPRITVLNNQEARILVGTKEVYVSTTTTTNDSTSSTAEQVTFVDVGVTLAVTPTINPDGFVTMKIKPEVSSTGTPYTTASGNQIPVVSTSEAETIVTVKDGSTIIIGGLIKDKVQDTVNKVPLLGDIPILGVFFKHKNKTTTKIELAIFLTPHIISGETSYFKPYSRKDAQFQDNLGNHR